MEKQHGRTEKKRNTTSIPKRLIIQTAESPFLFRPFHTLLHIKQKQRDKEKDTTLHIKLDAEKELQRNIYKRGKERNKMNLPKIHSQASWQMCKIKEVHDVVS
ncbi:hypothetical protein CEXT_131041 [Caerostris extrusa]|uniref:Uncharacterized protein n=1 Tax=Caerostris extrusa TaxID=172846 RepID=A0AAV4SIL5_CAEEX|nr:hypothetical protein CEXT_131041 [Caerostris extrusa]